MTDPLSAVLLVEERRRVALVAVDLAELDRLFSDCLVHVHSNGMVHDKATLLSHIAARRAFTRIDRGELTVRIEGNMAVMTGPMTNHMVVNGESVMLEGFVTQVLHLEQGEWKFTNFQLTLNTG